jgi:hypothetical protein
MRLAALRGLAAMGELAQSHASLIRTLLADANLNLREQSFDTLVAMHDPDVAAAVAEHCKPSASEFEFESLPLDSVLCIGKAAAFGTSGRVAGPVLMKFLASPSNAERALAIGALGYTGYGDATPEIVQALTSQDWRIVRAAVHSLGWLGAVQASPDIEGIASSYWLPEVREDARAVLAALKGSEGKVARPRGFPSNDFLTLPYRREHQAESACPSGQWEWQGVPIPQFPAARAEQHRLPFTGGTLTGADWGEFGGDLRWEKPGEPAQRIIKDNVRAILPAEGGAIVLFGLAHLGGNRGYVLRVSQRSDGGWSLTEVARLPGVPKASAAIGPNLYAALSNGKVAVFDSEKILGLAECRVQAAPN